MPDNDEVASLLTGQQDPLLVPKRPYSDPATARAVMSLLAPHVVNPDFWKEPGPPQIEPNASGKLPEVKDPRIAGVVSDVAQTASNMFPFGGPAETAAGLAGKAIFGGAMAKTANLKMLGKARDMEGSGSSWAQSHKILDETGWSRGADGKWRFEIPDDHMKATIPYTSGRSLKDNGLGDLIKHPQLAEAYPGLMNELQISMKRHPGLSPVEPTGGHNPNLHSIFVEANTASSARDAAAHELQHVVQDFEGFAPGANPNIIVKMLKKDLTERGITPDKFDPEKWKQLSESVNQAAFKTYQKHAGEVESRNVESRLKLSPEERRIFPPDYTQDVPFRDQIIPNSYVQSQSPEIQAYIRNLMGETHPTAPLFSGTRSSLTKIAPEGSYPLELNDAVTSWAQGKLTPKEVQKAFKDKGWSVDLRRGRYDVEAFDPSGKAHYITP